MQYKYILLGSIAGIILVSQARAQDRWEGGYFGFSIDAIEATADVSDSPAHTYKDKSTSLGGLHAGYNFVRQNGFVWGPEVSLHSVSSKGSASDATLGSTGFEGSFLLSSKIRAGWANDRFFFFGTLGLDMTDAGVKQIGSSDTELTLGLSTGLGVEYAISDLWSTRLEVSKVKYGGVGRTFNAVSRDVDTSLSRVSIGISRKF